MLEIRYHMRTMGEAAGVPVSSFYWWVLILIVLCLHGANFPFKKCISRLNKLINALVINPFFYFEIVGLFPPLLITIDVVSYLFLFLYEEISRFYIPSMTFHWDGLSQKHFICLFFITYLVAIWIPLNWMWRARS